MILLLEFIKQLVYNFSQIILGLPLYKVFGSHELARVPVNEAPLAR